MQKGCISLLIHPFFALKVERLIVFPEIIFIFANISL